MKKLTEPTSMLYHSTFNEGRYEKKRAAAALDAMAARGYNVVRVFMNHATEGSIRTASGGSSRAYMDNLADFLAMAKARNLYVIPTIDWIPVPNAGSAVDKIWCPDFQCTNVHILTREGLQANKDFFVALVKELQKRKAPTDYILAYELRNELTFESDLPPLTLSSGTVSAANGKSYDLSSRAPEDGDAGGRACLLGRPGAGGDSRRGPDGARHRRIHPAAEAARHAGR